MKLMKLCVYVIPAGLADKARHISREGGIDRNKLSRHGMDELHGVGVQRLPRHEDPRTAVQVVADQWIPEVGAVHADLMGPARVQADADQAVGVAGGQAGEIRMGRFSAGHDLTGNDTVRAAADRAADGGEGAGKAAFCQRHVQPFISCLFFVELGLHLRFFGNHAQARRILVQAVHRVVRAMLTALFVIVRHGVCQRALPHGRRRVHEQACGLVDDEEVVVLVGDRQRDGLRRKRIDLRQVDADYVAFIDKLRCRSNLAVDRADAVAFDAAAQRRRDAEMAQRSEKARGPG